jgi:hypothetical protein
MIGGLVRFYRDKISMDLESEKVFCRHGVILLEMKVVSHWNSYFYS